MKLKRRNHYDVTDRVRISHPTDVRKEISRLLASLYPQIDLAPLDQAVDCFTRLYAGLLPGYLGCDTLYHDAQHSLDCALAMARLLDGHERSVTADQKLGAKRALLGVIVALFHDAGYIRKSDDSAKNGAEFTLTHVRRSGDFLADLLPRIGLAAQVPLTRQMVHFTGYEIALDNIRVSNPQDRMLGFLLGTADILAQTADRCYLEKCRDFLFREFEICGLAGAAVPGGPTPLYATPQELMEKTPAFNRKLWRERLDGYFGGAYRYMAAHFGGSNPYIEQIEAHLRNAERMSRAKRYSELRRRPVVIGAAQMRRCARASRSTPRPHARAVGAS